MPRPERGWLRTIREALGLPRKEISQALGVTEAAVAAYERSEAGDCISLATLRKVAEVMDCELVVALVPKAGRTFTEVAEQRIERRAAKRGGQRQYETHGPTELSFPL